MEEQTAEDRGGHFGCDIRLESVDVGRWVRVGGLEVETGTVRYERGEQCREQGEGKGSDGEEYVDLRATRVGGSECIGREVSGEVVWGLEGVLKGRSEHM